MHTNVHLLATEPTPNDGGEDSVEALRQAWENANVGPSKDDALADWITLARRARLNEIMDEFRERFAGLDIHLLSPEYNRVIFSGVHPKIADRIRGQLHTKGFDDSEIDRAVEVIDDHVQRAAADVMRDVRGGIAA